MNKGRVKGFLIIETLIALALLAVAVTSFWQSWHSIRHIGDEVIDRLARERAIANAQLLIKHQALISLPTAVSESVTLFKMKTMSNSGEEVLRLFFLAGDGEGFWHDIATD